MHVSFFKPPNGPKNFEKKEPIKKHPVDPVLSPPEHRVFLADVKSPRFTFHILLVCQKSGYETEIANEWQQVGGDPYSCTIVRYDLERDHDPLVVVDILDRIRAGIFTRSSFSQMQVFGHEHLTLVMPFVDLGVPGSTH